MCKRGRSRYVPLTVRIQERNWAHFGPTRTLTTPQIPPEGEHWQLRVRYGAVNEEPTHGRPS
jgi:hypothetical protein